MGRTGALIAPVVERMAALLKTGSARLYVDETTAPVMDPGRGRTKTGYLWAVLRDDRGWNGPAPPGVVFHYRPGRSGDYAEEILAGFDGAIQVDAYGCQSALNHDPISAFKIDPPGVQLARRCVVLMQRSGGGPAGVPFALCSVLEAPAFVAGFDELAMVREAV